MWFVTLKAFCSYALVSQHGCRGSNCIKNVTCVSAPCYMRAFQPTFAKVSASVEGYEAMSKAGHSSFWTFACSFLAKIEEAMESLSLSHLLSILQMSLIFEVLRKHKSDEFYWLGFYYKHFKLFHCCRTLWPSSCSPAPYSSDCSSCSPSLHVTHYPPLSFSLCNFLILSYMM